MDYLKKYSSVYLVNIVYNLYYPRHCIQHHCYRCSSVLAKM